MTKKKDKFLESALIAKYFGFEVIEPVPVTKEDIKMAKDGQKEVGYLDDNLFPMEEAIAILRDYKEDLDNGKIDPRLYYSEGSASGSHKKKRRKPNEEIINLHILNVPKSIADATLLKTAQTMLAENGIKNILVKINNIGGKEAQNAFLRESTNHYRKNLNIMNTTCRQYFKDGVHVLIKKGQKQCPIIVHEESPRSMDFLGDDTRKNFGEIIEFLETMSIPYEIDQFILGDPNYSSHTIFEIIDLDTDKVVAAGSRYNLLYKKIGTRKEIPAVGAIINLPKQKEITSRFLSKIENSKNYFMQIGYVAKLSSLKVIDDLRKHKIPVKHKLFRDRLSTQISSSKKAGSEFLIIMGQKEALEGTVIVRDKEGKTQSVIGLNDLAKRLKKLNK